MDTSIPSKEECFKLLRFYKVPKHIIQHSLKVSNVAIYLSKELNKVGEKLNLNMVEAASLLHDIAKMVDIQKGLNHALEGEKILRKLGYNRVGEIVGQHILLKNFCFSCKISEEEIVNYADKRVKETQIVDLKERFEDIKRRYGGHVKDTTIIIKFMDKLEKQSFRLEEKIFLRLPFKPEDLSKKLGEH